VVVADYQGGGKPTPEAPLHLHGKIGWNVRIEAF
jgi:hypothetical protein